MGDVETTPTLSYEDEPIEMTANEENTYYYVYVPASTGNVLTATESFYDQELTQGVTVVESAMNAYYFEVTTFEQAVEVSLADFSQTNSAVEVLFPLNVGDFYQGGIVFYIVQEGEEGYVEDFTRGLIVTASDQGSGAEWGCRGVSVGAEGLAIQDTPTNNTAIETGCTTSGTAADIAVNLIL